MAVYGHQGRRHERSDGGMSAGTVSSHYSEGGQTNLPETPPMSVKPQENSGKHGDLLRQILSGGTDKDKLLIGALMFALLREGGDMKLILALGYILL